MIESINQHKGLKTQKPSRERRFYEGTTIVEGEGFEPLSSRGEITFRCPHGVPIFGNIYIKENPRIYRGLSQHIQR